jgi:tRNA(Ile)-lysidine synthetase-like protein
MLSTVLRTIAAHALLERGDRVLVAVSGGPDSMALLHVLWEARERLGISLEVAAINHGLRAGAAAEIDLVRERAAALELPFATTSVIVRRERGRASLQDAARRARLAALAQLATERGARRIALGHHADDQAETVLFRIVRGTGLRGLAGIPYRRDPFVRPLLDLRRAEILRYLARRSIPYATDPSNADPRFTRARIRQRILPLLAEENPRVAEALIALAREARRTDPGPPPVPSCAAEAPPLEPPAPLRIDGPGRYRWAGGVVAVQELPAAAAMGGAADFDADRLGWPLMARPRRPGDRMRPRGGAGSRKLSDMMIDAKIARRARGAMPVVTDGRGVLLWVPGLRPAEAARPSETTSRLLRIAFVADTAVEPERIV